MNLDDEICYCFHVPLRKLRNFAKRTKPARPSQMSECLGAGTGCGWCIPILKDIFNHSQTEHADFDNIVEMTSDEYAQARDNYRKSGQSKNTF